MIYLFVFQSQRRNPLCQQLMICTLYVHILQKFLSNRREIGETEWIITLCFCVVLKAKTPAGHTSIKYGSQSVKRDKLNDLPFQAFLFFLSSDCQVRLLTRPVGHQAFRAAWLVGALNKGYVLYVRKYSRWD